MNKEKYLQKLIHEGDELLNVCLFHKEELNASQVAGFIGGVNQTLSHFKDNMEDYDLKVKSDDLGYLSGLSWFGRAKPNTLYRVYVEEVRD